MDVTKLTRDAKAVLSTLKIMSDDSMVTTKGCSIHIPSKYLEKGLAKFSGRDSFTLGILAIVVEGKWAMLSIPNIIRVQPADTRYFKVGDVEHVELIFPPGSTVFTNVNVVMTDTLVSDISKVFVVTTALAPWFMNYDDRMRLFDNTEKYVGVSFGANRNVYKFILAHTSRVPSNRRLYAKTTITKQEDYESVPVSYVPYSSVIFGPQSTSAKLMGSNYDMAQAAALSNPAEKVNKLEKLLME